MAKKNTTIPVPTGGSGVLPKLVSTLVMVALLVIVVKHPGEAANWTRALFTGLGAVVDGIVSFIRQVA